MMCEIKPAMVAAIACWLKRSEAHALLRCCSDNPPNATDACAPNLAVRDVLAQLGLLKDDCWVPTDLGVAVSERLWAGAR